MELVAFLGNDRENWGQITALINRGEWERILIVKRASIDGFNTPPHSEIVDINTEGPLLEMKEVLLEKLKKKLKGEFEVAVSLASGNGKEHMALIGALLNIPVGVRLVVFTKKGIEFVT